MNVVDEDHQRLPSRDRREQSAQRPEREATYALRILGVLPGSLEPGHALQDREEPPERPCVRRRGNGIYPFREADQVATQRVDDAVHHLVRDRFALVGPSAEDHRLGVLHEIVEETLDERGFAHARGAGDAHRDRVPRSRRIEGLAQDLKLPVAADESRKGVDGDGSARWHRRVGCPEALEDLGARRAHGGVVVQKRATECVQIGRYAVDAGRRGRRLHRVLHGQHVEGAPDEGWAPDERLVEDDADAVPVGRRRRRGVASLLGRHVPSGADHLSGPASRYLVHLPCHLSGNAEVEEHDAALGSDENVGRFDVAVQLAGGVQGLDTLDELAQGRPQPVHVGGRPSERRLRLGRSAEPRAKRIAFDGGAQAHDRVRRGDRRLARLGLLDVPLEVGSADEIHREEDLSVLGHDELVEMHQIGVLDVREGPKLVLEEVEPRRVEIEERLDGDLLPSLAVEGFVDDAHATSAQAADDLVSRRALPFGGRVCGACRRRLARSHPRRIEGRATYWRRGSEPEARFLAYCLI